MTVFATAANRSQIVSYLAIVSTYLAESTCADLAAAPRKVHGGLALMQVADIGRYDQNARADGHGASISHWKIRLGA